MSEANRAIGRAWIEAFNAQDLERLIALYDDACVHTSPKLRVSQPATGGAIRGKAALRAWWADAYARLPGLRYQELTITADDARVWLEYTRHAPGDAPYPVAEVFDVRDGRIVASRVYHG
jgi:hypothetical protein